MPGKLVVNRVGLLGRRLTLIKDIVKINQSIIFFLVYKRFFLFFFDVF